MCKSLEGVAGLRHSCGRRRADGVHGNRGRPCSRNGERCEGGLRRRQGLCLHMLSRCYGRMCCLRRRVWAKAVSVARRAVGTCPPLCGGQKVTGANAASAQSTTIAAVLARPMSKVSTSIVPSSLSLSMQPTTMTARYVVGDTAKCCSPPDIGGRGTARVAQCPSEIQRPWCLPEPVVRGCPRRVCGSTRSSRRRPDRYGSAMSERCLRLASREDALEDKEEGICQCKCRTPCPCCQNHARHAARVHA